uniref:Protein-serine O-palmitoleoyltransferase porcupine n=1 Tax=Ciona intestinalis TaxID=7719 RepID=H2XX93_CIOIN
METHDIKLELSHLASNCVTSVLSSSISQLKVLLISCVILRLAICLFQYLNIESRPFYKMILHMLSCSLGIFVLYDLFEDVYQVMGWVTFGLVTVSYICIWGFYNSSYSSSAITGFVAVSGILFGEFYYSNPKMWNRIRGVVLLMCMKVISVAVDYRSGKMAGSLPSVLEYCAYCLHPGSVIFGPWLSLQEFRESILVRRLNNVDFFWCIIKNSISGMICLVLCMCVIPHLFMDPLEPQLPLILPVVAGPWLLAYKSAVSFHFSHYYVCYIATLTSQLAGTGIAKVSSKKFKDFVITRPLDIEIPRSMLDVVVAWNIPMSKWLKYYVFDTTRFLGNFSALLFSYAASAILHGLNLHLAAILLTLCLYTYIENALRLKLSKIFNCNAIQSRPPRKVTSPIPIWARLFNFMWILINLMHLAYLGTANIFQDEEDEHGIHGYSITHTLKKWGQLGFTSHIFAAACLLFNWFI